MLATIEHDKSGSVCQSLRQHVGHGAFGTFFDAANRRQRVRHETAVAEGSEVDEPCSLWIAIKELGPKAHREARLAGATGPGERDQPGAVEQPSQLGQLRLAADKRGELGRKVVRCRHQAGATIIPAILES